MSSENIEQMKEKILKSALKTRKINASDIYDKFLRFPEASDKDIKLFIKTLRDNKISVIEQEDNLDEDLNLDFSGFTSVDDPVKMYLKDIEQKDITYHF